MKTFKQIDFWISIALAFTSIALLFFRPLYAFYIGYFGIGAWHILSMLVHSIGQWFCAKSSTRYNYQLTVLILLLVACLGFIVIEIVWVEAVVMFFAGPVMAIFYTYMCYDETYKQLKRPLTVLK